MRPISRVIALLLPVISAACVPIPNAGEIEDVDMPFLDAATLRKLLDGRQAEVLATAFEHADGTLEPLCTVWEPAAGLVLTERVAGGDGSLRRLLEAAGIQGLEPPVPGALVSVNSPAQVERARRELQRG